MFSSTTMYDVPCHLDAGTPTMSARHFVTSRCVTDWGTTKSPCTIQCYLLKVLDTWGRRVDRKSKITFPTSGPHASNSYRYDIYRFHYYHWNYFMVLAVISSSAFITICTGSLHRLPEQGFLALVDWCRNVIWVWLRCSWKNNHRRIVRDQQTLLQMF
jgi:hypothetical protein